MLPELGPTLLLAYLPDFMCRFWVHLDGLPKEHRQQPRPHLQGWGILEEGSSLGGEMAEEM